MARIVGGRAGGRGAEVRIAWLEPAIADLQRLRAFIATHNPEAAGRAARLILAAVAPLATSPRIGRPVGDLPGFHDLIIPFGASGYVLRYRIDGDAVYIVMVRHGREAGFNEQSPPTDND